MDAYELTRPILAASPVFGRRRRACAAPTDALADARRYVHQLPLGLTIVRRLSAATAAAEVERAVWALAVAEGVAVDVDDPSAAGLAGRLVAARSIVAPAADAVATLLPAMASSGATLEGIRLAELLVAYLEHRTVIAHRFPARRVS